MVRQEIEFIAEGDIVLWGNLYPLRSQSGSGR